MAASVGVIADDLSGAMDAGLQLVNENYSVKVLTRPHKAYAHAGADISIVNTESRHLPPEQAAAAVKNGVKVLKNAGRHLVYKKIDSTLRGNIGAELEGVLAQNDTDCVIVAPALPNIRRTTVNGIHYVEGVRLQDTEFARDPLAPAYTSSLEETVRRQTQYPTSLLSIDTIRLGTEAISRSLGDMVREGVRIIACDAIDDGDLSAVCQAASRCRGRMVLCGSAGLIKYLGQSGIDPPQCPPSKRLKKLKAGSRVLVISGTPAMISRQQILEVSRKLSDVKLITADPGALLGPGAGDEAARICRDVGQALSGGYHVLLDCAPADGSELMQPARNAFRSSSFWMADIPKLVGRVAETAVSCENIGAVILFEGSAAISFLDALGVTCISILRQTEPYMPLGILEDGKLAGLNLITKPASFGGRHSLVNVMNGLIRRIQK